MTRPPLPCPPPRCAGSTGQVGHCCRWRDREEEEEGEKERKEQRSEQSRPYHQLCPPVAETRSCLREEEEERQRRRCLARCPLSPSETSRLGHQSDGPQAQRTRRRRGGGQVQSVHLAGRPAPGGSTSTPRTGTKGAPSASKAPAKKGSKPQRLRPSQSRALRMRPRLL